MFKYILILLSIFASSNTLAEPVNMIIRAYAILDNKHVVSLMETKCPIVGLEHAGVSHLRTAKEEEIYGCWEFNAKDGLIYFLWSDGEFGVVDSNIFTEVITY